MESIHLKEVVVFKNDNKYTCPKKECECGGRYFMYNKSKHIKSDKHQKFITGIDFNEFKVNCACGGKYTVAYVSNHKKTKRHIEYMHKNYPLNVLINPNDENQVKLYKFFETNDI